jgi:predicted DNA binding CopG/RHH family protein
MEIKCLIEPLSVRREFKLEDYFDERARPQIRVFSEPELVARRLVQSFPPDAPVAQSESEGVHVIIVGLGSVGQSILVQLARQGHYRSGKKPKVTVVDRSVGDRWREAREAYPALERWLQVEKEETRFEAVGPQQIQKWLTDERPVTVAYVCTKDEIVNLRIARMLLEGIKEQPREDLAGAAKVVARPTAGTRGASSCSRW